MDGMTIRAVTLEEWKYTYAQSTQLLGQTGGIGYIRGAVYSAKKEGDRGYGTNPVTT